MACHIFFLSFCKPITSNEHTVWFFLFPNHQYTRATTQPLFYRLPCTTTNSMALDRLHTHMQRVLQQLTRMASWHSIVIPAMLMRLSRSEAAFSGPEIPGTDGLTLGALLSMVPMSAMVGSGIARLRWSQNSARWMDGVSPLLLTYVDCQSVLDTTIGPPMVAAHLNQSSIFDCQDTVGVSSLIRSAADEDDCYAEPGGRSQKLACVDWRVRHGDSTYWRCYACYSLASVVVGLGWTYGSWVSGLALTFMVLQMSLQIILMMRLDKLWKGLLTKKDSMAYFLAPNWNSDESYFVVGPRDLLSKVIGDRRKFDSETLFFAQTITTVGAITVGLCVILAATGDLPGLLGFIALVTISLIGSHPRFAKDIEPLTCNLTFARRRSAYTLAYIMHGSPEQLGWWNGAFPSTDRQTDWERNVRAWINGETFGVELGKDDMGDLFSVQNALVALHEAGFKAVHTKAQAGVDLARNADLKFLRDIHSTRKAEECLKRNCFCRKEQDLADLAAIEKDESEKILVIVEAEP
ncbi:MAG: hypothetical protein J3R72DRAFT_139224 [Linnemannia gamsii]|nr:MAG: hypothetical protein J3R72DRAFT_139224 [Linnemannia gamsii]